MNSLLKLGVFLVGMAAVFGASFLTGTQAQTLIAPVEEHQEVAEARGFEASEKGYTLSLPDATSEPGDDLFVEFSLLGPDQQPVTEFTPIDGSDVHVVAVRRDLTGYQHITPEPSEDGTWWAALNLTPGPWRLFANFEPTGLGEDIQLGVDLDVAGDFKAVPLPPASTQAEVDGFTVTLTGEFNASEEKGLGIEVTRDGEPVTDLQTQPEYYVHAVAIRPSDFGYVHLHADQAIDPGPWLPIGGVAPSQDLYRLFVEFKQGGMTYAVPFTIEATP